MSLLYLPHDNCSFIIMSFVKRLKTAKCFFFFFGRGGWGGGNYVPYWWQYTLVAELIETYISFSKFGIYNILLAQHNWVLTKGTQQLNEAYQWYNNDSNLLFNFWSFPLLKFGDHLFISMSELDSPFSQVYLFFVSCLFSLIIIHLYRNV